MKTVWVSALVVLLASASGASFHIPFSPRANAPGNVTVTELSATSVRVNFQYPTTYMTGQPIPAADIFMNVVFRSRIPLTSLELEARYRSQTITNFVEAICVIDTKKYATFTGLDAGPHYFYVRTSTRGGDVGIYSEPVSFGTLTQGVTGLRIEQ